MFSIGNRRFVGSKQKLASWIIQALNAHCSGNSFFEVFAGTSIVSSIAAAQMKHIILNDTLLSNNVIYSAFYGSARISKTKLEKYKKQFNEVNTQQLTPDWFTQNYGGKYFGCNDCAAIETVRNILEREKEKLTSREYNILLASLIYSIDRIAHTVGHFDAYIQTPPKDNQFSFDLIEPLNEWRR